MAWGGLAEQQRDREAGNPDAKDWHDEALKIVEKTMEKYWQPPESNAKSEIDDHTAHPTKCNTRWLESEFDCHCWMLIEQSRQSEAGSGWSSDLCHYLGDLPIDVTKKTDVIQWWAVCLSIIMYQSLVLIVVLESHSRLSNPSMDCEGYQCCSSHISTVRTRSEERRVGKEC